MSGATALTGGYDVEELERWNERIEALARQMGLDFFPLEFEVCDHDQMLGFITYSGMPAHYRHWSFGKAFERQKTLYDKGLIGLPYEMVINSNPCLAYLMRDNSLTLQVLTMAHVYGHDDFFKNNQFFSGTRPELTVEHCKSRAQRVARFIEDPSIGPAGVERILDAAHALQFNINPNRLKGRSVRNVLLPTATADTPDPTVERFSRWQPHKEEPEKTQESAVPLDPEADLLIFIRNHHTGLQDWEKDLLTIVHEESCYFLPQIETKIMNEGWACFWHKRILDELALPTSMQLEFLVHHNQVVRPHIGGLNPYHLGYVLFNRIFKENGGDSGNGMKKIMAARQEDRDSSFLRRYLTEEVLREMDMFMHEKSDKRREITEVADADGWKKIKTELLRNVGSARIPGIKVTDVDMSGDRAMHLTHDYDGRELELMYAEKTVAHIYQLWGARVVLDTYLKDTPVKLIYDENGMKIEGEGGNELKSESET